MKIAQLLFLVALGAAAASAQQYILEGTSVDLTTSNNTYTIASTPVGVSSGTLKGFACRVTTTVTGSPSVTMTVNVDYSHNLTFYLYQSHNYWTSAVSVFQTSGYNTISGEYAGDTFYIPMDVSWSTGLSVTMTVGTGASAGAMQCWSFHS